MLFLNLVHCFFHYYDGSKELAGNKKKRGNRF